MEPVTLTQDQAGHAGAVCPDFHAAIELIGKRWTGAIVSALTERPMRFGELRKAIPGLSDRLLSQRLRELEEEGLVQREVVAGTPVRVTYSLTAVGNDLGPAIRELRELGQALEMHRVTLPGPFAVGQYARKLQEEMRKRARVQLMGEVTGVGRSRVQAFFELRDADGAVPCSIWLNDLEKAGLPDGALRDGAELVIGGGPDYYPGGGQASPSFSFRATEVRLAGEGDLMARLEALRKQLRSEGLFELQGQLRRPLLPKAIGVVTAESGAARRDLLAGLARRGWEGSVVWAFAPVQDRRAAPAITAAIGELAARPEVEAIVVTRGGGSLADLWAFCDETLCRTVAMLRVPVISAVGHERDSTLIDDVAAVACSTPTHAAEAAVRLDCIAARQGLRRGAGRLRLAGEGAIGARTRHLGALARGPARALQRERGKLNQATREIRAAAERGLEARLGFQRRIAAVVLERARQRGIEGTLAAAAEERRRGAGIERAASRSLRRRREALRQAAVALRAHDPERTLERGYALAETTAGEPVTSASAARAVDEISLRFADGRVDVRPSGGARDGK